MSKEKVKMLKCFCEYPLPLDTEDICATKCGHIFHHSCLLQWLEINAICPQCRAIVTSRNKFRLYPTMSDEPTEQETIVNEALQKLEVTQTQLNQMATLCMKKDKIIEKHKKALEKERLDKQDSEALKNLLMRYEGDNMDILFNDPYVFDCVLEIEISKSKNKNLKADILKTHGTEPQNVQGQETQNTAAPISPAGDVSTQNDDDDESLSSVEEIEDESAALQYTLDTLGKMINQITELDDS